MLGDAAAEGRCGCVALCEGPQEDCPLHGRDYAWWVGLAGTACADREWLMAENARLREGIERLATEMQRGRLIPGTPVFGCAACGMPNESEACEDHDEGLQHAGDMLRALLAEGGE